MRQASSSTFFRMNPGAERQVKRLNGSTGYRTAGPSKGEKGLTGSRCQGKDHEVARIDGRPVGA